MKTDLYSLCHISGDERHGIQRIHTHYLVISNIKYVHANIPMLVFHTIQSAIDAISRASTIPYGSSRTFLGSGSGIIQHFRIRLWQLLKQMRLTISRDGNGEREGERERENHWTIEIPVIILHPLPHFNPLCQDLKWTTSPKVPGLLKTGYPPP